MLGLTKLFEIDEIFNDWTSFGGIYFDKYSSIRVIQKIDQVQLWDHINLVLQDLLSYNIISGWRMNLCYSSGRKI